MCQRIKVPNKKISLYILGRPHKSKLTNPFSIGRTFTPSLYTLRFKFAEWRYPLVSLKLFVTVARSVAECFLYVYFAEN